MKKKKTPAKKTAKTVAKVNTKPGAISAVPAAFAHLVPEGVWLPIAELKRWAKNPRKNEKAVPRVKLSIERFGFVAPICIWTSKRRMVAGHTRLDAVEELVAENGKSWAPKNAPGPGLVKVTFHEFANEAEATAYAIADNRLGELAEWDEEARDALLEELAGEGELELVDATGYDAADYLDDDEHLVSFVAGKTDPDEAPEPPKAPVTRTGDMILLGPHRLVCGDCRDADVVAVLVAGETMDLLWTDPPYGVSYVGGDHSLPPEKRAGKGNGGKVVQNDTLDDKELRVFLLAACGRANQVMRKGACFYVAHPAAAAAAAFFFVALEIGWHIAQGPIWVKDRFVLGRSDYHARHESILYGWKEGAAHHAVTDRTQDTIWEYPRPARSDVHPTMKPVELVERALANSTDHGDKVLDLFGGSGTTLIACERRERRFR